MVAALTFGLSSGMIFTEELPDYTTVPASFEHIVGTVTYLIAGGAFQGLTFGTLAMIILGAPAHALLLKHTSAAWWHYALAGAFSGAFFALVIALPGVLNWWPSATFSWIGLGAAGGLSAALLFWLIRRPDRDARPAR